MNDKPTWDDKDWDTYLSTPTIGKITRTAGIAGQFSLTAEVTYPGESLEHHQFVGNAFGGPIVIVSPSGMQTFVSREVMDRIGSELTPEWIQRFYAPRED